MRLYTFLLPLTVLTVAAAQVLVPGKIAPLSNQPGIADVAPIPARADHAKLRRFLDYQAIILPEDFPGTAAVVPGAARLGYSYREFRVLKLPIYAYGDLGIVMYDSDGRRHRMIPLNDDYRRLLDERAGTPIGHEYVFPFWWHMWGWLIAVALIVSLVSWLRDEAAKRAASGIM